MVGPVINKAAALGRSIRTARLAAGRTRTAPATTGSPPIASTHAWLSERHEARGGRAAWKVKATKFDEEFDRGKDVTTYLNVSMGRRPGLEQRRVNVDIPAWMIESLDREAERLGVPRQSLLKLWIAERLEALRRRTAET